MKREDARRLLDRIGVLRHRCDLDLLLFFARHPRTLVTSEQLAAWLGYEPKQIAESLEILLEADLLTQTQNPTHPARMYVIVVEGPTGGWLPLLLEHAATRPGRLAILEALSRRASEDTGGPVALAARADKATRRPRPFVVRRRSDETPGTSEVKAIEMERGRG